MLLSVRFLNAVNAREAIGVEVIDSVIFLYKLSNLEIAIVIDIFSVNGLIDVYLLITEIDDVIDSDIFLIPNNVLVSESLEVIDSDNPLSDCNTLVIEILDVIEIAIALLRIVL